MKRIEVVLSGFKSTAEAEFVLERALTEAGHARIYGLGGRVVESAPESIAESLDAILERWCSWCGASPKDAYLREEVASPGWACSDRTACARRLSELAR